jgi:S-methylmethionine-dependent homocysteine/selenocysteine methylase
MAPAGGRDAADRLRTPRRPADPLAPLLATGGPVVIDGGLATELEEAGHDLADRLWSARLLADEPEAIVEAHLAYFRAGARIAITASYQATFEGFAERGLDRAEAAGLLRRSVELASEARHRRRAELAPADPGPLLVAASIGPYGAFLADGSEYRGDYPLGRAALRDWHRARLEVLWSAGPDLLACETIPVLAEAEALADLVAATGAAAWLALTCADGGHLRDGSPVEDAAALADMTPGFVAVGVNCTPPEHVEELVGRIRSRTAKPIVVYPNSGEGWDAVARRWLPAAGPTVDGPTARAWVAAGATFVGGCCRVGPSAIEALARELATPPG